MTPLTKALPLVVLLTLAGYARGSDDASGPGAADASGDAEGAEDSQAAPDAADRDDEAPAAADDGASATDEAETGDPADSPGPAPGDPTPAPAEATPENAAAADPADSAPAADAPAKTSDLHWPMVLFKAGVGAPFPLTARVEVFVLDGLSLEGGVTAPFLIPGTVGGGVRWRPRFACLGCDGNLQLRAGIGVEGHTFYGLDPPVTIFDPPEWMIVASPGATVFWRAWERFGVSLGARLALGVTSGLEAPLRFEPTGYLNIELGFVVF